MAQAPKPRQTLMTDNVAILAGYTKPLEAYNDRGDVLFLLVKPDVDLDSAFRAWDTDCQEWLRINGWLWLFEWEE
jgi:hypothetical protein